MWIHSFQALFPTHQRCKMYSIPLMMLYCYFFRSVRATPLSFMFTISSIRLRLGTEGPSHNELCRDFKLK
jgi:hypothetical protein